MAKIIGILVVFSSVLGGFALAGGKIMALIHPFELLIIGGGALGAFIQSNRGYNSWRIIKKSLRMFSTRYNRAYYLEVAGAEHRSEEHTSELQSREKLVCRPLPAKTNCSLSTRIRA